MARRRNTLKQIQISLIVIVIFTIGLIIMVSQDPLEIFEKPINTPSENSSLLTGKKTHSNWWQVYFTDPEKINSLDQIENSILRPVISDINEAKRTIHIATPMLDLSSFLNALISAHQRGIQIRLITDDILGLEKDANNGNHNFALLQGLGIPIKSDPQTTTMQQFFIIIDGQTTWTGSASPTQLGILYSNTNLISFRSPEIASIFEQEFSEMWAGAFSNQSPSIIGEQNLSIDTDSIQLLFGPEDHPADWVFSLFENAQQSINFVLQNINSEEFLSSFLEKDTTGVLVKGIVEQQTLGSSVNKISNLICKGIEIRHDESPALLNQNFIIIDNKFVILGSHNLGSNLMSSDDQTVILMSGVDIASQFLLEFNRLWEKASSTNFTSVVCP